jgi:pyridoxamine 5'-phosphate oxidase
VDPQDLDPDPHVQFDRWFADAREAAIDAPERMALATASATGVPSARMVLLKGHDERGFAFYTNRSSRKARELEENPRAAAVLYWEPLQRQVRIEGMVETISEEDSAAYFRTRPRESRISAWASPQSQPLGGREELEARVAEAQRRFENVDDVPLPPFWGGYRIVASMIEFWQGRPNRLHDRVRYELADGCWRRERLAP